jgi:hypothetical protein
VCVTVATRQASVRVAALLPPNKARCDVTL